MEYGKSVQIITRDRLSNANKRFGDTNQITVGLPQKVGLFEDLRQKKSANGELTI